jgi:hypothetical protein
MAAARKLFPSEPDAPAISAAVENLEKALRDQLIYSVYLSAQKRGNVEELGRREILAKDPSLVDLLVTPEDGITSEKPINAPNIGWWILALTCSREQLDAIWGDLQEDFLRYATGRGAGAAYWWFWIQITKSFAHLMIRMVQKAEPITRLLKKSGG